MERLTYYINVGGNDIVLVDGFSLDECVKNQKFLSRLAEHENKLEEGLLVELPCKVGDSVFIITENYADCDNCKFGSEAKYDDRFRQKLCDVNGRRCPLEIETQIVEGFTVGTNGVSDPGTWDYEGLGRIFGADNTWYLTYESAQTKKLKMEEENEINRCGCDVGAKQK